MNIINYVECANNVTTFSGCGQILKADACEMRLYSQIMANQLPTHTISGKYLHWLVRYSPSKTEFIGKRLKQVFRVIYECI